MSKPQLDLTLPIFLGVAFMSICAVCMFGLIIQTIQELFPGGI